MKSLDETVRSITQAMGIDAAETSLRKDYLEFGADDVQLLTELHERLTDTVAPFIDDFYRHLLSFDTTRALLTDEETLRISQARYFNSLTAGDYGPDYINDRLRIGVVHQRIGLEPKWYLGAYAKYMSGLLLHVYHLLDDDPERTIATVRALLKVVFLDMGLALETYIHADREAILHLKEYAESIICSVPSGLLVLDERLKVISANRFFTEVIGVRHEKLGGRPIESALPAAGLRDRVGEVLHTGIPQYDIAVNLLSGRGEQHFRICIIPMSGAETDTEIPRGARLLITLEDLTERDQLRAATLESDARVRAVMDNVIDGIITINEHGAIESFNHAAERLFGYRASEVLGQNVKILMPEPYHSEHDGYLERYLDTHEPRCLGMGTREVRGRHKGGTEFPMELAISEMGLGERRLFIGLVRDITDRRQAEAEREMLQKQLQQAQKMEAIGQLTGGIAHDFNNILAVILGYTGLALEQFTPKGEGKLGDYLNQVMQAGERARDLISQMMAFSRHGEGGAAQPIEIVPIVQDVIKMLRATLPTTLELETQFEEDVPLVCIDPVQLHQAVMNLGINARDAQEAHGTVTVEVRHVTAVKGLCTSCHHPARGDFVAVSVRDTGHGMEESQIARIFEPFFTTKTIGSGTGMGLSVVHGIVHESGGHILVSSVPGEGSIFRLLMPALEPGTPPGPGAPEPAPEAAAPSAGGHILLVDDESGLVNYLSELLETRGYRVTAFSDATGALTAFMQDPTGFDLVITDQTMPKMTGAELAAKILSERPDLPVILCTGHSDHIDEDEARRLNISCFLAKPTRADELLTEVSRLLS